MKFNDATEAAYKNGYADGVKETAEKLMLEVRDLRIELKAERELAKVHKAEIEGYVQDIRNKTTEAYIAGYKKGTKEFAERLKEKAEKTIWISSGEFVVKDYTISKEELDNLLEEMESERK